MIKTNFPEPQQTGPRPPALDRQTQRVTGDRMIDTPEKLETAENEARTRLFGPGAY